MKVSRLIGVIAAVALMGTATPASSSLLAGGVKGGGFLRQPDQTKATLAISGADGGVVGDSGQAQFVRHKPGSPANAIHINLLCVNVIDSVAISSGLGSDGRIYLVVVKDNGQGQDEADEMAVVEMVAAHSFCLTGTVPTSGVAGSIQGGNFQVFSS